MVLFMIIASVLLLLHATVGYTAQLSRCQPLNDLECFTLSSCQILSEELTVDAQKHLCNIFASKQHQRLPFNKHKRNWCSFTLAEDGCRAFRHALTECFSFVNASCPVAPTTANEKKTVSIFDSFMISMIVLCLGAVFMTVLFAQLNAIGGH